MKQLIAKQTLSKMAQLQFDLDEAREEIKRLNAQAETYKTENQRYKRFIEGNKE